MEHHKPMSLSYMMTVSSQVGESAVNEPSGHHHFHDNHTPPPTSLGYPSSYLPDLPKLQLSVEQERSTDDDYSLGGGSRVATLAERRKRNKNASAKYRQKKNKQQVKMRQTIDQLKEQGSFMKQRLIDLQIENQKIKSLNDNLRGEIFSQSMLHRHFDHRHYQTHSRTSHKESYSTLTHSHRTMYEPSKVVPRQF
ncbi:hypothetical protein [Absidia glauca]|uniref:BZIP domain-containing protein n=1 Tax=Absidia glauca TaxID=4829 RepID=A0A168P0Y5_ABSGL|nr:hypothetical protein [Absidia glauca]